MAALDPTIVRQQISNLRIQFPELLEDEEAWLASLESETEFNELLTKIIRRIEDTRALVSGTSGRLQELAQRKERFQAREESLRGLLHKLMDAADLNKVELPEATISLRNVAPSVIITDEAALPDFCIKTERKPDKAKIKEWLAEGYSLVGATMSNGSKTISIRIK